MAHLSSIARPYALAAFEYAREKKQLAEWKAFLETASTVARDPDMIRLLANPELASKCLTVFEAVLKPYLDAERKNFLYLLAQNKRLALFPDVSGLFMNYYSALEKISHVKVITAVDAEEAFQQKLKQTLGERIHHEVTLQCEKDPSILGGAIIHLGDRVIDGSLRGKLTRLLQNLTS